MEQATDKLADCVIRGGRIVTSAGVLVGDIAITGHQITAIAPTLGPAKRDIVAEGKWVMPGGVDCHAHIEQMSGMGVMNADTFETATRSAAFGGTTSVISFAAQARSQRLSDALADYQARARRGAMIDYAFHLIISDTSVADFEHDLATLIAQGHRSLKIFTTYNIQLSDAEILQVLGIARDGGALVCVHAENDAIIAREKQALLAAGNTAPPFHAVSRPAIAEVEAVERMCRYATHMDQSVMLFHLSAAESADAVKQAKRRGAPVWAETCPHYLFMTEDVLNQPGLEGAKYMCSPPQRTVDDQEALWHAIAEGQIELVSSDHAPYRFDATGKLSAGDKPSFAEIANGLPGLETRLPLLFDEMVSKGRLGPEAFCALTASVPARRYGLQNKGSLEVGKDADIVIWNPDKRHTYGGNDLHDNVGYNPWVGRTVTGWPERVMLRGQTLLADGDFAGTPGAGQWIARPEAPTRQDFGRPGCGAP